MRSILAVLAIVAATATVTPSVTAAPECGAMDAAFVGVPQPVGPVGVKLVASEDCTGAFVVFAPAGTSCLMIYKDIVTGTFFSVVSPNSCTYGVIVEEQQLFP